MLLSRRQYINVYRLFKENLCVFKWSKMTQTENEIKNKKNYDFSPQLSKPSSSRCYRPLLQVRLWVPIRKMFHYNMKSKMQVKCIHK